MNKSYPLKVEKRGRSFCVVAGKSVLGRFGSEEAAERSLKADLELYRYWAGSAGVSVENSPVTTKIIQ